MRTQNGQSTSGTRMGRVSRMLEMRNTRSRLAQQKASPRVVGCRVTYTPPPSCRSPPPSWSASALRDDDALVHVGAQQSSPSLPFSQPLLPAVPASPPQVGMSAHHAEPATSGQQGKHTVPPDVEQRHAQLDDWQKKMHQRFRREMMGQLPDELPPLSPMQGTDAGIRDAEGRGRYSDLHQKPQMDGNYYAAHAHDKYHAGPPPMHQFVDPAGMLAHHDLQNSPAVTAGGGTFDCRCF